MKELADDIGVKTSHDLTSWAEQGVLLLNACLTVPAGQANGHAGQIWEPFTDAVIRVVNNLDRPVVFVLWGAYARKKKIIGYQSSPSDYRISPPESLIRLQRILGFQAFFQGQCILKRDRTRAN